MKRRRLLFAVIVAAPIAAVAVACSFPDVEFSPDNADGSVLPDGAHTLPDGTIVLADGRVIEPDTGTDANVAPDTGSDAGEIADAEADADAALDATMRPDSSLPDGGDAGCVCDCDNDGWATALQKGVPGCSPANPSGTDCDDNDPRAHPGQTFLPNSMFPDASPTQANGADWNCDESTTYLYDAGLNCSSKGVLQTGGCGASAGFLDSVVGCDQTSDYVTCVNPGALSTQCAQGTPSSVTQGCK